MTAATELTADEAQSLERAFLSGLNEAQDAYERIVQTEAWKQLGYDAFGDWWAGSVQPVMRALSMRPTREIATAVVDQVRAEEASLPPAQRRTQRELAELAGVDQKTVSNWSRSPSEESSLADDLGESTPQSTQAPGTAEAEAPPPSTVPGIEEAGELPPARPPTGRYRSPATDPAAEEHRQRLVATHQLCEVVVAVAQMRGFDTGWKYDPSMALPGRAVTTEVLADSRQAIDELIKIWDERGMP